MRTRPERHGRTTAVRSGAIYITAAVAQRGLAIALLPVFAVYLGPADFGLLALATTVSGLVGYFLLLGLDTTIFRDLEFVPPERRDGWISELRGGVQRVALPIAGLGMAAGAIAVAFSQTTTAAVCLSVAATAISTMGVGVGLAVLRAAERPTPVAGITMVLVGLPAAGRLMAVVVLDAGAMGAVVADLLVAPLVLAAAVRIARLPRPQPIKSADSRLTVHDGLPLIPHQLSHWALVLGDRLIVAPAVGLYLLGIYSLGYQAGFAVGLVLMETNRAILPLVSRNRASGSAQRSLATAQLAATCLLGIAAFCTGPALLIRILPPEFSEASRVFVVIAAAYVVMGLYFIPMNQITMVMGQTRGLWRATACAAVANLALNAVLTPRYGIVAAALCTLLAYSILLVLMTRIWWSMGGRARESLVVPLAVGWVALAAGTAVASFYLPFGGWTLVPLASSLALGLLTIGTVSREAAIAVA